MKMTINGKSYELNFGLEFIRKMDAKYYQTAKGGQKFGQGIEIMSAQLLSYSPTILLDIVEAGLHKVKKGAPTPGQIEEAIEGIVVDEGLEKVMDDFFKHLEVQPFLEPKMKKLKEKMEESQKQAEAEAEAK